MSGSCVQSELLFGDCWLLASDSSRLREGEASMLEINFRLLRPGAVPPLHHSHRCGRCLDDLEKQRLSLPEGTGACDRDARQHRWAVSSAPPVDAEACIKRDTLIRFRRRRGGKRFRTGPTVFPW